jgi:hypothetical protein
VILLIEVHSRFQFPGVPPLPSPLFDSMFPVSIPEDAFSLVMSSVAPLFGVSQGLGDGTSSELGGAPL